MISQIHPCGCVNVEDEQWGVLRNESKCKHHRDFLRGQIHDAGYYKHLGVFDDEGNVACDRYVREMEEAIGPFPPSPSFGVGIEIGCGVSPYVPAIQKAGYFYVGIEPSPWPAKWVSDHYHVSVINRNFPVEGYNPHGVAMIFAAHSLEHLPDAPGALKEMYKMLVSGGHLRILVPDDQDRTNPDHLWFFTVASLTKLVKLVGFIDVVAVEKQVVPREKFIYLTARKA